MLAAGVRSRPLLWFLSAAALAALTGFVAQSLTVVEVRIVLYNFVPAAVLDRLEERFVYELAANPLAVPALLLLLLLQRCVPARGADPKDRREDLLWVFFSFLAAVALYDTFIRATRRLLGMLDVGSLTDGMPALIAVPLVLLVKDFLGWVWHRMAHSVRFLWRLHAVHHSTEHLSIFSRDRHHPVEMVLNGLFLVLPFTVLGLGSHTIIAVALVEVWWLRFQHADVKTNLGPLRHVLVTPQSHRIHHSIEREHWNQNYGILFPFWDRLFGTENPDVTSYPATGLLYERRPPADAGAVRRLVWRLREPFPSLAAPDAAASVHAEGAVPTQRSAGSEQPLHVTTD